MLFSYKRGFISESASADMLDPDVDQDVKDVVEDLQDTLTTNVEEVPEKDKESNGASELLKPTAESCMLYESSRGTRYVNVFDIMRICEAEEADTGVAPDAGEVTADVAATNDTDKDDLVIVAPSDVAEEIIENALNEAKSGKKNGKNKKKAKGLSKALKQIKKKGFKAATLKK